MKTTFDPTIFVVEDDFFYQSVIIANLKANGYLKVQAFSSGEDCEKNLSQNPDIIMLDYDLGTMTGIDVLKKIKAAKPATQVIFLSGQGKIEIAVVSMKYGAFDYVIKNDDAFVKLYELFERINLFNINEAQKKRRKEMIKWIKWILIAIPVVTLLTLLFVYWDYILLFWKMWTY